MAQEQIREQQKEIFYAILTGYVKYKLGGGEITFELWQEKGSEILKENWLHILSIYTVLIRCCGLTMVFAPDDMLQGDDAKHYTSYGYATFLASDAQPNEMYTKCEEMMIKIITEGSTKQAGEN